MILERGSRGAGEADDKLAGRDQGPQTNHCKESNGSLLMVAVPLG